MAIYISIVTVMGHSSMSPENDHLFPIVMQYICDNLLCNTLLQYKALDTIQMLYGYYYDKVFV